MPKNLENIDLKIVLSHPNEEKEHSCNHDHDDHDHHHHHGKGHGHHHHHIDFNTMSARLLFSVVLNFLISLFQIVGGIISGSLSLISDSLHNLSDSISIFFSYLAIKIGGKKSDNKKTYGYKRVEILTAFFNSLTLIAICIFMVYEAILRLMNPPTIDAPIMLGVAVFGLLANLISVLLLNKDKSKSLNIKSAYLHLLGDTISSVLVIIAGVIIYYTKFYLIDLIVTFALSAYLIYESYLVTANTVNILMQSVPTNIDLEKIRETIVAHEGVATAHHIHIWSMNENQIYFECHIDFTEDLKISEIDKLRSDIAIVLMRDFGITHATIQAEFNSCLEKTLIAEL